MFEAQQNIAITGLQLLRLGSVIAITLRGNYDNYVIRIMTGFFIVWLTLGVVGYIKSGYCGHSSILIERLRQATSVNFV